MKKIEFTPPKWVDAFLKEYTNVDFSDIDSRMSFAVELSLENIRQKTGGPFGAAIFNSKNELVAVGINMVVTSGSSLLHAENMAIMQAQDKYADFDLSSYDLTLVSSAQPCIMCFGATMWSGVLRLEYGATKSDVETIVGFDEGPTISSWENELDKRGVAVTGPILREKACRVLSKYAEDGHLIYNPKNRKES